MAKHFRNCLNMAGAYPSCHWARGGVDPGQVGSPSQGHTETIETHNLARSHSLLGKIKSHRLTWHAWFWMVGGSRSSTSLAQNAALCKCFEQAIISSETARKTGNWCSDLLKWKPKLKYSVYETGRRITSQFYHLSWLCPNNPILLILLIPLFFRKWLTMMFVMMMVAWYVVETLQKAENIWWTKRVFTHTLHTKIQRSTWISPDRS